MIPNTSSITDKLTMCLKLLNAHPKGSSNDTIKYLLESVIKEMQENKDKRLEKMIVKKQGIKND